MSEAKQSLFAACRHLLKPVIRVLLRHGVTYGEFAEVAKSAYADVARDDFSLPGKKATDSRVAILTGLSRKQVKQIREAPDDAPPFSADSVNRATRVLSGWHQDTSYTDDRGLPRDLPFEGGQPSFASLVKKYSGDMTARAMLDELLRVGAVAHNDNDQIRVLSRSYIPAADNPIGIKMLGTAMGDLGNTIAHNLDTQHDQPKRFQRMVLNERIDARALPLFQRYIDEHGQKFLEMLDDWLSAHEIPKDTEKKNQAAAGFGIYLIMPKQLPSENQDDKD